MTLKWAVKILAAILVINVNLAVDRNKFRTCQQSSFCRRCRGQEPGSAIYALDSQTLQVKLAFKAFFEVFESMIF